MSSRNVTISICVQCTKRSFEMLAKWLGWIKNCLTSTEFSFYVFVYIFGYCANQVNRSIRFLRIWLLFEISTSFLRESIEINVFFLLRFNFYDFAPLYRKRNVRIMWINICSIVNLCLHWSGINRIEYLFNVDHRIISIVYFNIDFRPFSWFYLDF